jgi:hypothetical protein
MLLPLVLAAAAVGWPTSGLGQAPQDEVLQLTFDDVEFDMEKDEEFHRDMLTPEINDMQGRRISIRGYILPNGTKQTGNRKFILVRDNQECCFGPGAALYDCVLVKLKEDHEVDFTVRPVTVEGIFQLKELKIGGRTMAIFRMLECVVSQ